MNALTAARPLERVVVLDDDPTGVQTLGGIRVLLDWDPPRIADALARGPSVHLVTNSRALAPNAARERVADAAVAAFAASPGANLVLRGDSTLRGHLLEEYQAVQRVVAPGRWPPLLLVPALPAAGRVTRAGIHLIERDGTAVPLHETEYASDADFSYTNSRLVKWAEARSRGFFAAENGRELDLFELRNRGPAAVTQLLQEAWRRRDAPIVIAPDAETDNDLRMIAGGYAAAIRAGVPAIVRCSPTFAGILTGTTAATFVDAPALGLGNAVVVCGSYVPTSIRQLDALRAVHPGIVVEADARALGRPEAVTECHRVAAIVSSILRHGHLAVVATNRPATTRVPLELATRVAAGLAEIARLVVPPPKIVIAKGGITSAVTLRDGFGTTQAEVIGPVLAGVSYWRAQRAGRPLDYLVVPGNVGGEDLLVRLLELITT
jgi:uncharacterized protein YgbK (DUF1537 family)